ncbi:MAG: DUF4124 domain-containing protein [Proteobacteria bacterium]|nr:DUF4124 domain-containing protein [Pseudomonadota bacterium]
MRRTHPFSGRPWLAAALALAAAPLLAGATLYKWVDENGVTHYSDRPEPGAQRVKIEAAQGYQGKTTAGSSNRGGETRAPAGDAAPPSYTHLAISNPTDGAVLWNTGGRVEIGADLEPALADGHSLWLIVDGKSNKAGPGNSAVLELTRGEHTASASVTDAQGIEIVTSAEIKFVVRQTSAAQPPTGPLLQKPAKPH